MSALMKRIPTSMHTAWTASNTQENGLRHKQQACLPPTPNAAPCSITSRIGCDFIRQEEMANLPAFLASVDGRERGSAVSRFLPKR